MQLTSNSISDGQKIPGDFCFCIPAATGRGWTGTSASNRSNHPRPTTETTVGREIRHHTPAEALSGTRESRRAGGHVSGVNAWTRPPRETGTIPIALA